jgi:hypothetical protein
MMPMIVRALLDRRGRSRPADNGSGKSARDYAREKTRYPQDRQAARRCAQGRQVGWHGTGPKL